MKKTSLTLSILLILFAGGCATTYEPQITENQITDPVTGETTTITTTTNFDFVSCKNEAKNTLESNECFKRENERLLEINGSYFKRVLRLHQDNLLVVDKLKEAREAFIEKKNAYCSAQYEIWIEGSIRNIMYLECSHLLIKQNTYFLWETYLMRMDYGNRDPKFPNPSSN